MDYERLREMGWNVYPAMLIKEQDYPYLKCVAALKKGRVNRVYWSCVRIHNELKKQFLEELRRCDGG